MQREVPHTLSAPSIPVFTDYNPPVLSFWDKLKEPFDSELSAKNKARENWEKLFLPNNPGRLLDIGAGDLRWSKKAMDQGWTVESIHSNPTICEEWRKRNLNIQSGKPQWEDYSDETFDAVVVRWVLEAEKTPSALIENAWRVLKPNGRLILIAWNNSSYGYELYTEQWLPLCIGQYQHIFSPGSLRQCAIQAGVNKKIILFSSVAGQLPQSNPPAPETDLNELRKKALRLFSEEPLSGEALILIGTK